MHCYDQVPKSITRYLMLSTVLMDGGQVRNSKDSGIPLGCRG